MIVLIQRFIKDDGVWDDMAVPTDPNFAPVRGERPRVSTPEHFAEQLQKHGHVGTYRVVMATGLIWLIVIERKDTFVADITAQDPV